MAAPQARMALLGGLMIAVKCSTPNMPRLLTVKVLSAMSSADRPRVRAFSPSALLSALMARRLLRSASRITATTSPPPFDSSSATATPTFTCLCMAIASPAQLLFT